MKYTNANLILPEELIEKIQEYVQGEYIYIPIKDKGIHTFPTDYKIELKKRDAHIFTKYLEGVSNRRLAQIYNLSESSIRRIIIKEKKGYNAMTENINNILVHWGLFSMEVKQIYDTAWQVGENYILKVYDNLSKLERNLKILQALEKMNIPVGRIIASRENERYVTDGKYYYFLAEKLQGNNIVNLKENAAIGVLMGETIANLHEAFKECEKEEVFWNNSLLDEMKGWVRTSFEKNGWKYVSQEIYDNIVDSLALHYGKLPVQLIHRDVHFGNFLFNNGKFSGYIDFDLSQRNIRIFDLCYFLLGLLSEEEKMEITELQWFDLVMDVFSGYEKKIVLSVTEKEMVPCVMECIELLFVAYFVKINDIICAKNAFKIFEFVRAYEERIRKMI